MAHSTIKSSYDLLTQRLNRFPQGAPPSDDLFAILRLLYSEKEASLVSLLPIRPFDADRAAAAWRTSPSEASKLLDELAGKALLLDTERDGKTTYCMPPPMAGFFEFSMMRVRNDLDQKALAELFYQYLTVERKTSSGHCSPTARRNSVACSCRNPCFRSTCRCGTARRRHREPCCPETNRSTSSTTSGPAR
jgi:hypothetical protein